jgi:transcriptional regulator GlxA family with amidase domain
MLYHMARQASEPQRLALSERTGVRHSGMLDIVSAMEANLKNPLPLKDLAKSAQISPRQMERLFMRDLKKRPAQYYRELRLKRARQMVQQTGMSMMQIAVATGFATAAHFARAYRMLHGVAPSKDRAGARTLQSSSASAR